MTDTRQYKQGLRRLRQIQTWQLVVILILMLGVTASLLRLNNVGMSQRRAAVIEADKGGDSAQIQARLYDLQRYVSAHMNTSLDGGFDLKYQYERDRQKAIDGMSGSDNPNGNIFKKAQDVCRPRFSATSQGYLQCVFDEIAKYGPSANLQSTVKLPDPKLYHKDFASPRWSPDFAGFSVLICLCLALVIAVRLLAALSLRLILKFRNRGL